VCAKFLERFVFPDFCTFRFSNRAHFVLPDSSYREIECGCDIFYVHDEQGFFPEECCVSSSGEPFEDACEDIFDTCQDAIAKWCEKMGISQGDRTEDEMVDFINGYEYENEGTYYYINKFTFD